MKNSIDKPKLAERCAVADMLKDSKKDMKTMGVIKPFFLIYEKDILALTRRPKNIQSIE